MPSRSSETMLHDLYRLRVVMSRSGNTTRFHPVSVSLLQVCSQDDIIAIEFLFGVGLATVGILASRQPRCPMIAPS
jgi:hypothetical protein